MAAWQKFIELDHHRRDVAHLPCAAKHPGKTGEFQHGEQADAHEAFVLLISKLLEGCICARGRMLRVATTFYLALLFNQRARSRLNVTQSSGTTTAGNTQKSRQSRAN